MEDKIKLKMEYENQYTKEEFVFKAEFDAHFSINDMLLHIERFLLGIGYSQDSINDYLKLVK